MKRIRRGMWRVVNATGGTGRNTQAPSASPENPAPRSTSGITTPPVAVDDFTTWFLRLAPYDAPRYAIAVVVENGTAGARPVHPSRNAS